MINGVTQLVMTKADVLDNFDAISAATAYETENGVTDELPFDMVTNCPKPVYKAYKGWKTDLTGVRNFGDFPSEVQDYIQEVEDILEIPFSIISVGPGREQLVLKPTKIMA